MADSCVHFIKNNALIDFTLLKSKKTKLHGVYLFHALPITERPEGSEEEPQGVNVENNYGYLHIDSHSGGGWAAL